MSEKFLGPVEVQRVIFPGNIIPGVAVGGGKAGPPIKEPDVLGTVITLSEKGSIQVGAGRDAGSLQLAGGESLAGKPEVGINLQGGSSTIVGRSFFLGVGMMGLGGQGSDGILALYKNSDSAGLPSPFAPNSKPGVLLQHDGQLFLGLDKSGNHLIHLDGTIGDIKLSGADCAENFRVSDVATAIPGTVLVIGDEDRLEPCSEGYDHRVAGVVSGAGDLRPGIRLDCAGSEKGRVPVALVGKVNCLVDAIYGPITVGDLLTTSPTMGHAMKVDAGRSASGAILGKALRGLQEGCALIPILVTLQ